MEWLLPLRVCLIACFVEQGIFCFVQSPDVVTCKHPLKVLQSC